MKFTSRSAVETRKNCWGSDTMCLSDLQKIYYDYEQELAEAHRKSSIFSGIMGQGTLNDPRSAPCNQKFLADTEAWVKAFAASAPEEAAAEQVCRWILDAAKEHRNRPAYWHYLVAQGYVKELIPVLSAACCQALAADYNKQYPKRVRLPIQEDLYRSLCAKK